MEPKNKITTGKQIIIKYKVKKTNQVIKTPIRELANFKPFRLECDEVICMPDIMGLCLYQNNGHYKVWDIQKSKLSYKGKLVERN